MKNQGNTRPSSVLITGVSSGIGLGMARTFLSRGHRVFGSVRSPDRAEVLRQTLGENFEPLVFDVCNQEEVDRAERALHSRLPEGRLSALINNAGSAEIGPLLHVEPEVLSHHMDTLVVGQLRVTQRFFPYLVSSQPAGRIINISSVSGTGTNPFFGCYAAAKHALEGLSKTLREEVRRYGVPVVIVAPGNIATEIWGKQRAVQLDAYATTDYLPALQERLDWIEAVAVPNAMSTDDFAAALYDIYADPTPAERYTIVSGRKSAFLPSRRAVQVTKG